MYSSKFNLLLQLLKPLFELTNSGDYWYTTMNNNLLMTKLIEDLAYFLSTVPGDLSSTVKGIY